MYSDVRKLTLIQGAFQSSSNLIIGLLQPEPAGVAVLVLQTSSFTSGVK